MNDDPNTNTKTMDQTFNTQLQSFSIYKTNQDGESIPGTAANFNERPSLKSAENMISDQKID